MNDQVIKTERLELVTVENNIPVTTSLKVAQVFERKHGDVCNSIEKLINDSQMASEQAGRTFSPSKMYHKSNYKDSSGKENKIYYLTRDGLSLLVMGFNNTPKVLEWKLKYIDAFNRMEEYIKNQQRAPTNITATQVLIMTGKAMEEHENRLAVHDQQLAEHTKAIENNQQSFIAFSTEQQTHNTEQDTKTEKLDQRLKKIETKTANIPIEYPPVNIEERNRIQKKAGALCQLAQQLYDDGMGALQRKLQDALVTAYKKEFDISLLAELEDAKKWYKYNYCCLKADNPKVPDEILRPSQVRNLSLYAIIATNPVWIRYFDQYIDRAFFYYQKQVTEDD